MISDGHVVAGRCGGWACGAANSTTRCACRTGTTSAEVQRGSLEPGGQLVLDLKAAEQGATKADIAEVTARLSRIESLLGAAR